VERITGEVRSTLVCGVLFDGARQFPGQAALFPVGATVEGRAERVLLTLVVAAGLTAVAASDARRVRPVPLRMRVTLRPHTRG
jgi:hypothetical protein